MYNFCIAVRNCNIMAQHDVSTRIINMFRTSSYSNRKSVSIMTSVVNICMRMFCLVAKIIMQVSKNAVALIGNDMLNGIINTIIWIARRH